MKDLESKINRLANAHKKQLKRLLRSKEHAKTAEAQTLHDVAVKSFLEVGKGIIRLEAESKAVQAQIRRANSAMHNYMREI